MSEIRDGDVAIVIGGENALFTAFKNRVDPANGDEHFQEVIVAKKYAVSVPFPWSGTGGVGRNLTYGTPQLAEQAGKNFILGSPSGSNYQVDRWWVASTSPIERELDGYPTPQNDGFTYVKTVKLVNVDDDDALRALFAFYSKTVSSTKKDYRILIATPDSSTPECYRSRCDDHSMSNPSGTDFDDEAENLFGATNYVRSVLDERITKLAPYQSFPSAWP